MRQLIAPFVLLLAVAACGEVKNFADAAVGDDVVEVDADTTVVPDAVATGAVTVTATHRCCTTTGPAAGVDVIVVSPDGTVGDTVQTAADGTATVQVTAGDSVTTILHEGTQHFLTSHLAVEPGDQLRVGGDYRPPGVARGAMTVTWNAFGAATSYYYVHGPCGSTYVSGTAPTTLTYAFRDDCGVSTFDVAVVAYGANGIAGWRLLSGQTFAAGGTLALGTLQNAGTFAVSMSGIPAEVTYASSQATGRVTGESTIYGGQASGTPEAGSLTGSFQWSTAGAGTVIQNYFSRDGNFQGQQSRETLPPSATAYNRTSVELLPWIGNNFTVSPAARAVTWIQSGDQPYDGAVVLLNYYRMVTLFGGSDSYHWIVVMPPGVTNLQFPALPAAYSAHDLLPNDNWYGGVMLFDRSDADGYPGFRGIPVWEFEGLLYGGDPALDDPAVRWSGQAGD